MIKEQKCLAFVGTGEGLLPYIYKAKEMGIKTVLFARGKDTFARDEIDVFVEENNFDIKYMASKCKELHVDGIMAFTDFTTEVVAKVAHEAGLPGNDVELGFAGRDKYVMRCRVQNLNSVKQPKFELYDVSHKYEFPVVVKALDSSGKKGITLVKNENEFLSAVKYAKENSSDGCSALIEEYLDGGQEYSVNCLVSNGMCQIVQYTEKDSAGAPHFVELGHHQPAQITLNEKEKIDKAVKDILHVLGINCGMAFVDLKIINGDIYFIEVGARASGNYISNTLIALSTDFDYFRAAIEASVGIYEPKEIHNISSSGIYFYCKQNEKLLPLFKEANNANWCYKKIIFDDELHNIKGNSDAYKAGYFIYNSDSKISLQNYKRVSKPIVVNINNSPFAYKMLWDYYKENNSKLSDEELDATIKDILNNGKVFSFFKNFKISECIVQINGKSYIYPEIINDVCHNGIFTRCSNINMLLDQVMNRNK